MQGSYSMEAPYFKQLSVWFMLMYAHTAKASQPAEVGAC